MPFDTGFRIYPWVEKLLAIRHRPLLAHVLAIILVLIAVVVIGVLLLLGGQIKSIFTNIFGALGGR